MIMTRPLIALATLLLSLALPVGIAHAGEPWPVDPGVAERPPDLPSWLIASRLGRPLDDTSRDDAMGSSGLSDLGAVLLREGPGAPVNPDPLTLPASGEDSTDLRALLGRGDRWHLMSFGAAAANRPQDMKVTAYGAVAYLPSLSSSRPGGSRGLGPATAPGAAFGLDDPEEPVSLGFKGELAGLGLEGGAEYRSVGKRLERVVTGPASQKDREGTEVWLAQTLGLLRLKLSQSDLSDNVDRDPAQPRTTKVQTAVSAQIAPPAPHLHAACEPVQPVDARSLHHVPEHGPHRGRAHHERERGPGVRARQDPRGAGERRGPGGLRSLRGRDLPRQLDARGLRAGPLEGRVLLAVLPLRGRRRRVSRAGAAGPGRPAARRRGY